jgi:transposase
MARGQQLHPLTLTDDERAHLLSLSRRRTSAQGIATRARIVLAAAEGKSNLEVADAVSVTRMTVGKWRSRFLAKRIDGLFDEPRSGAPRKITDAHVESVVTKVLESTPKNATHWSTRSLAKETGMSQSAISRIFRAFALAPHRAETFKLSNDPLFVEKVRDIVGLYMKPPAKAVVLCVDEKTQIQALDRTQPVFPMRPGLPERRTRDYVRHGTTTLFAALDVKTGQIIGDCRQRHRATEFVQFLRRIDDAVPKDLDLHVILDNVSTHKTPSVRRWLVRHPRFHLHFTPTYASWINLVERWFAEITDKQIRRGTHKSTRSLIDAIRSYLDAWNKMPTPFVWTKTADDILAAVGRFCSRISDSGQE